MKESETDNVDQYVCAECEGTIIPGDKVCPHCGSDTSEFIDCPEDSPKKKGLAIASLICGIIGGSFSTFSIPAIICGHIELYKMKKEPSTYGGKGIAIAGVVLGYLGLVLAITLGVMRALVKNELRNM